MHGKLPLTFESYITDVRRDGRKQPPVSIRPTIIPEHETIEITPNDEDINLIADLMAKNNGELGGAVGQALGATLPGLKTDVSANYNERICLSITTVQVSTTESRSDLRATAISSPAEQNEADVRVSRLLCSLLCMAYVR